MLRVRNGVSIAPSSSSRNLLLVCLGSVVIEEQKLDERAQFPTKEDVTGSLGASVFSSSGR